MRGWSQEKFEVSPEVQERAVRVALEQQKDHDSQWAAIGSISGEIGCSPEMLRRWVRQAERDYYIAWAHFEGNQ